MLEKREIREINQKLRRALSPEECAELSKKICSLFFSSFDLSLIKTLHIFLPIISKNEPDTRLIIKKLKEDFPQIKISVPKVENERLINFYFEEEGQLKKSHWDIPEPTTGEQAQTKDIDLVIVPLLAFDKKGNRVGYGKGFYDKFLSECKSDCKKIGLSFFGPTDDLIQVDSFDIPLDAVITPAQVFTFKS